MSSKNLLKIITFLVFVVIIGTPLFYFKQGVFPFVVAKTAFFQAIVEVLFGLWVVLAVRESRFRPKKTPLLIALGVFIGALTATSLTGVDFERSFWSTYERAFGMATILHFAAFALVVASIYRARSETELLLKKTLYASVITGTIVAGIAVIQLWVPALLLNSGVTSRPGSTFDNPTFFAGYVLLNLFFSVYLFFNERRENGNRNTFRLLFFGVAAALNVAVIFIAQTRGDILALCAGVFVLLLFLAVRPPASQVRSLRAGPPEEAPGILSKKVFYRSVAAILVAGATFFWFTRSNQMWTNVPGLGRFSDISTEDISIQPRLIALRAAWRGFTERPLLGWGWDNFNVVFNKHYDPFLLEVNYQETRFDKPHNFFMEYLVAGGALLALGFLALAAFFALAAWRLRDRLWGQTLIAAFVAYVVHNLFVFETIGPALLFYLMIGLTAGASAAPETARELFDATEDKSLDVTRDRPRVRKESGVPAWHVWGALGASLFVAYYVNIRTIRSSYYEFLAFNDFVAGRVAQGIEHFKQSIVAWSPYRWNFARDYAAKAVETYFYQSYPISEKEVRLAIQAMEWVRDEHPEDSFNHYMLVDLYNQASAIDPETFLAAAEREADIALKLSPNRQQVYFSLAKTKYLQGEKELALKIVQDTIALNPRVADGHFYYGLLAFAANDLATGYNEIHEALRLGRKWKNYYELRTVAGFVGDSGRLDEAIDLYKTALEMEPGDTETQIKLGVAYFLKDDLDVARKYLSDAAKKFDFKKSASYGDLKPILDRLGIE